MGVFTRPYDTLLDDFQETARPQREGVEGRGLLLIAAHFLSGVGAGGGALASAFGDLPGEVASVLLLAASGLAHLLFLGRPARFWRMVRARTSWVGRGFLGLTLALAAAVAYLALTLATGRDDTAAAPAESDGSRPPGCSWHRPRGRFQGDGQVVGR